MATSWASIPIWIPWRTTARRPRRWPLPPTARSRRGHRRGPDGGGAGNRLLFDGMYYYTYDAEGNRTARYEIASGTDMAPGVQSDPNSDAVNITIYTWNNANQMTSATFYATAADWTAGTVNAVGETRSPMRWTPSAEWSRGRPRWGMALRRRPPARTLSTTPEHPAGLGQ